MFENFVPSFVLISAILSTLTIIYLNKLLNLATASYATMMTMVVPVIVTVLGLIFLKEPINIFQILGGIIIIISGILVQKKNI